MMSGKNPNIHTPQIEKTLSRKNSDDLWAVIAEHFQLNYVWCKQKKNSS